MRKLWGDETLISNIFSSASFRLSLSISLFLFITPFHSNYPYHGIDDVVIHVPSHFFLILFSYFFPPLILLLLKCSVLMDLRSTTSQWTEQLNKMKVLEVVLFLPLPFIFWWIYRNFAVEKHKPKRQTRRAHHHKKKINQKKSSRGSDEKKMLNLPCILALTRQHF